LQRGEKGGPTPTSEERGTEEREIGEKEVKGPKGGTGMKGGRGEIGQIGAMEGTDNREETEIEVAKGPPIALIARIKETTGTREGRTGTRDDTTETREGRTGIPCREASERRTTMMSVLAEKIVRGIGSRAAATMTASPTLANRKVPSTWPKTPAKGNHQSIQPGQARARGETQRRQQQRASLRTRRYPQPRSKPSGSPPLRQHPHQAGENRGRQRRAQAQAPQSLRRR
jgi:hypothetical protein